MMCLLYNVLYIVEYVTFNFTGVCINKRILNCTCIITCCSQVLLFAVMHVLVLPGLLVLSSVVTAVTGQEMLCPPWFIPHNSSTTHNTSQSYCVCSQALPFLIYCNQSTGTTFLRFGNCAFWNGTSNNTLVLSPCPYVFPDHVFNDNDKYQHGLLKLSKNPLSLNSFMCNHLNRTVESGRCGHCTNGTGPSIGTAGIQCVECSPVNILYYILLRYLPATAVFLLVFIVQIDITSAPMALYVLYCNALVLFNQTSFGYLITFAFSTTSYKYILKVLLTLNSIWSFDPLFFLSPPLCLSRHMEDINTMYIDFLATLYPFLLLFLAFVLVELHAKDFRPVVVVWKPILHKLIRFRREWNPKSSLVQAFSTLFFLSYAKLIFMVSVPFGVTFYINEYGQTINVNECGQSSKGAPYIDPTIPFWDTKHIILMAFSISILLLVILPPILVLIAYPTKWFRKVQHSLSSRTNLAIQAFVSPFQGCFKDGTNGTCDYRALSGGFLAAVLLMVVIRESAFSFVEIDAIKPVLALPITVTMFIILTVGFAVFRPYKSDTANHTGVALSALLAVISGLYIFLVTGWNPTYVLILAVIASIPHFIFYGCLMYRIRQCDLKRRLQEWFCCYKNSDNVALLRHD